MLKKTKVITYNLADRDRKHNGVDRSDLDIRSAISHINSPKVQELVKSNDLYGYYGHEIRARFGMNPPDSWVNNNGETIRIEPAIRTISLSADSDGNVSAQHEFLGTDSGRYAEGLYSNNAGGFSSAIMRRKAANGLYEVTSFDGFDYVRQPNYNTNRGNAMFDGLFIESEEGEFAFDSLEGISPQQAMIKSALETAILHQYDNINGAAQANVLISHYQDEAMNQQEAYITRQKNLERLRERRSNREAEVFDGLICPSTDFSIIQAQFDSFAFADTSDEDLKSAAKVKSDKQRQQESLARRDRVSFFKRR